MPKKVHFETQELRKQKGIGFLSLPLTVRAAKVLVEKMGVSTARINLQADCPLRLTRLCEWQVRSGQNGIHVNWWIVARQDLRSGKSLRHN